MCEYDTIGDMKKKKGLIIGRFQPFHKGHLYLLKKGLEHVDKVIIAVGSVNISNDQNPFTFDERKKQIEEALNKYALSDRVEKIVSSKDDPDDDIWLQTLLSVTGPFDLAFGNNEWVNGIFEGAGYKVVRIPFYKREIYEGTKIRKIIKKSSDPQAVIKKFI